MHSGRRAARGFSYLWTLLLVAMLGIGMSVAAETYSMACQRDRERQLLVIGHEFRNALRSYHQSKVAGKAGYPAELADLVRDPRTPGVTRHLRRIHVDPMTGKAEWGLVRVGGRIVGVYSLAEASTIKRDNFAPEDAAFRGREKIGEWIFAWPPDMLLRAEAGGLGGGLPATPLETQPETSTSATDGTREVKP